MSGRIFINYRREDSDSYALSIAQYLENAFGKENVFLDIDRLRPGQNFPIVLEDKLADCGIMLVVIGPRWLEARDQATGDRRLDRSDDWVRLEIERALVTAIWVIPVLVAGASLPPKNWLPPSLQRLVELQCASVTTNSFRNDMAGLARDISELAGWRPWRKRAIVATALGLAATGLVGIAVWWAGVAQPRPPVRIDPACVQIGTIVQPKGPNVEASVIEQYGCSGRELWLYRYTERAGFRVVEPRNNWHVIGNYDSYAQALAAINRQMSQ